MNITESAKKWQRQLTTKVYLHPPRSDHQFILFPDFKIVTTPIRRGVGAGSESSGFIVLNGLTHRPLPWRETKWKLRDDGVPIRHMENADDAFTYKLEAFCSSGPHSSAFSRLNVKNRHPWKARGCLHILVRTGSEVQMYGFWGDGYSTYDPMIEMWGRIANTWSPVGEALIAGEQTFSFSASGEAEFMWVEGNAGDQLHERHYLKISFDLEAEQSIDFDFRFHRAPVMSFSYEEEKKEAETFWLAELADIVNRPDFDSPGYDPMFFHLVVQMLQMIISHYGERHTAVLQGGVNRGIWPTEAVEFLLALDQLGMHRYPAEVYEYFCSTQILEGDEKGSIPSLVAPNWACNTGAFVWGLSQHLLLRGNFESFERFRKPLLNGFDYIRRTRAKTLTGEFPAPGLFPPMQATDWAASGQSWCWTDAWNVMGLQQLSRLFEKFGAPEAGLILQEHREYRVAMASVLDEMTSGKEHADEILISNLAGIKISDPPSGPYFADGPANLIRMGLIAPGSRTFVQVENYFRNRRIMDRGLCGLMTDNLLDQNCLSDHWAGHTWYLSLPEASWFFAWMANGEFAKADETFHALLKYGMSSEYVLAERYADNDAAFAPWQPNASAAGRLVTMMFAYFDSRSANRNSASQGDRERPPSYCWQLDRQHEGAQITVVATSTGEQ